MGLQFALFGLYLWPIHWDYTIPDLILWPAQLAIIVGLILIGLAFLQMGKRISPFPRPKEETELISWGVFGLVRHPIYSGIILFCIGLALYQEEPYKLFLSIIIWLFFFAKSTYEERNMLKKFPKYREYKKKTGRFFPKVLAAAKPK